MKVHFVLIWFSSDHVWMLPAYSFLTGRSQLVWSTRPIPSLWPQIQVLPSYVSVLHYFTHSTQNDYTFTTFGNFIVKFADDSTILNLLFALSNTYFSEVNRLTEWCTDNFLELSTQKTKEVIFDPKSVCMLLLVVTSDQTIEQVGSYKFLGIHIDSNLSWGVHVEAVGSWAQKCLYFLQQLRAFGVSTNILLLFCHATIESMIRYSITSFYGNLSVKSKSQLLHITGTFSKIHSRKSLNRP